MQMLRKKTIKADAMIAMEDKARLELKQKQ
jgi:hypothetical protein